MWAWGSIPWPGEPESCVPPPGGQGTVAAAARALGVGLQSWAAQWQPVTMMIRPNDSVVLNRIYYSNSFPFFYLSPTYGSHCGSLGISVGMKPWCGAVRGAEVSPGASSRVQLSGIQPAEDSLRPSPSERQPGSTGLQGATCSLVARCYSCFSELAFPICKMDTAVLHDSFFFFLR